MSDLMFGLLIIILVAGSCLYGYFLHRNQIFPYQPVKALFRKLAAQGYSDHGWAIGTYVGPSPFHSKALLNIKKPALTAHDVTDMEANSVGDPFIIRSGSCWYMFFEAIRRVDGVGVIGLAESENGKDWKYKQVVIEEPFHLSYPYVFEWENDHYLIPESSQDYSVRIYRAIDFPCKWEYAGDLLKGYHFVDSSILRHDNLWWLFVSTKENDVLNLYYAEALMGPWTQHPHSPIVRDNHSAARPAGRVLMMDGKLYRFAQDDHLAYGSQVLAFEISEISRTTYKESPAFGGPVVKGSQAGWNADRMHHIDAHLLEDGQWLVAVDGFREASYK